MKSYLNHSSVQVSLGALVVLTAASAAYTLPWPLWATWAALSGLAVAQAHRARHVH